MSGVYQIDIPLAEFMIGSKIESFDCLNDHIKIISETKIFLIDFIEFQYGVPLNEKSPVHKKCIYLLKKHGIDNRVINTLLGRVPNRAKEEEEEEDKDIDKESSIKTKSRRKTEAITKPTIEEVKNYINEKRYPVNAEKWYAHYESNGWKVGKNQMKDWKAAVRTWLPDDWKIKPRAKHNEPENPVEGPELEILREKQRIAQEKLNAPI